MSATLTVYDMSGKPSTLATYDEEVFVATLQGIVNRDRPKIFVVKNPTVDGAYVSKLLTSEGPLAKAALEKANSLEELVKQFRKDLKGVCVWDPDVPATLNVAITAAGVEDAPVIRYDKLPGSLYQRLVTAEDGLRLTVILDLVGKFKGQDQIPDTEIESTGSKKCDVYLWAKARYLDTGKAGPTLLYNCDGYRITLFDLPSAEQKLLNPMAALHLDYVVAQRAFAFDLSPFDDEFPKDDAYQRVGEDARTMKAILASAGKQAKGGLFRVLGFPHSDIKYSNAKSGTYSAGGKHSAGDLTAAYGKMLSSHNAYVTGSLQFDNPNLSVHCKSLKPGNVTQNPGMTEENLIDNECLKLGKVTEKTFLTFIIGDFNDATSIYNELLPRVWQDSKRGTNPISWAISPELVEIFPIAFKQLYETRSKIDYFVSPASGAGYVNPGLLPEGKAGETADALTLWAEHCKKYYKPLAYTISGNVVNGLGGPLNRKVAGVYAGFSPTGIVSREGLARADSTDKVEDYTLVGTTPIIKLVEAPSDIEEAADNIHNTRPTKLPNFIAVHCYGGTPSFVNKLLALLVDERPDRNYTVLDPYAFFDLLRRHLQDTAASSPQPGL